MSRFQPESIMPSQMSTSNVRSPSGSVETQRSARKLNYNRFKLNPLVKDDHSQSPQRNNSSMSMSKVLKNREEFNSSNLQDLSNKITFQAVH